MAEGVVFLSEEGDGDGDECDEDFGGCGVPAACFDKEFEADIVEGEVDGDYEDVAEELFMCSKGGLAESDVFIEPETCEQGYGEDDAKCGDMWCYAKRPLRSKTKDKRQKTKKQRRLVRVGAV